MSIRNELLEQIRLAILATAGGGSGGEGASVVVRTIDDFPGGYDATNVNIGNVLSPESYILGDNLDMQGRTFAQADGSTVTMRGDSVLGYTITTDATGALFSGDRLGLVVRDCGLDVPNGSYYNLTRTSGFAFSIFKDVNFKNCQTVGFANDLNYLALETRFLTTVGASPGMSFAGANFGTFRAQGVEVNSFAGTLMDFGSTVFQSLDIETNTFRTSPGNVLINALPDSGNIASDGFGYIYDNVDADGNGAVVGLSPGDLRIEYRGNANIPDSVTQGACGFSNPSAPDTPISAGTYVDLVGVAAFDPSSGRFQADGNNGLKALNLSPKTGIAQAVVVADKSGFGERTYTFTMFEDPDSGVFVQVGQPITVTIQLGSAPVTVQAPVIIRDGYRYKVQVRGEGTSDNIRIIGYSLVVG